MSLDGILLVASCNNTTSCLQMYDLDEYAPPLLQRFFLPSLSARCATCDYEYM